MPPVDADLREIVRVADLVTRAGATETDYRLEFMRDQVARVLQRDPGNVDALLSRLYLLSSRRPPDRSLLDAINEAGLASGRLGQPVGPDTVFWAAVAMKRAAATARAGPCRSGLRPA